jgi:hypothetical protein
MNGQEFHWFGKIIDLFDFSASYFACRKTEDPLFSPRDVRRVRIQMTLAVGGGVDPGRDQTVHHHPSRHHRYRLQKRLR